MLSHSRSNSCIVHAFTNIEKSHTQTARPGTTTCTPCKYLFRGRIESETRSAGAGRSTTAPNVTIWLVIWLFQYHILWYLLEIHRDLWVNINSCTGQSSRFSYASRGWYIDGNKYKYDLSSQRASVVSRKARETKGHLSFIDLWQLERKKKRKVCLLPFFRVPYPKGKTAPDY